jgi:hypothetical protein
VAQYHAGKAEPNSIFYQVLGALAPIKPAVTNYPATVSSLSPTFVIVANQSETAAGYGLDQLHGMGLRKALEFLVKDFAISQQPDKAEEIKKSQLGNCIKTYIADANVKACAELATWLGNDETHYVRKWETKDITDLHRLVHLTVNAVDNVLLTKKYLDDMKPQVVAQDQSK